MTTVMKPVVTTIRRKALGSAIERVLTPHQLTMARELAWAENPRGPKPQPEQILFWMRFNMPVAAARVDAFL